MTVINCKDESLVLYMCFLPTHFNAHLYIQVWCAAMELQNQLPALRKLGASISSNASEWKEYFEVTY